MTYFIIISSENSNLRYFEKIMEYLVLHWILLSCFVFQFQTEIRQVEHFCFLLIKQSPFCPSDSSELL